MTTLVAPGPGSINGSGDRLALFLKVFAGEVLTAFARSNVTMTRHIVRTITSGKSAQFPIMGRTKACYLTPGEDLDDKRKDIKHNETIIPIDGLLTADALIYDIDDAMNHYDIRSEYTTQLGEALAVAADAAVLAELIKMCQYAELIPGIGAPKNLPVDGKNPAEIGNAIIAGLAEARAHLTKNYVPASDRFFYTSPEGYSAILTAMMPQAANYAALIDPEKGTIRNVMGFEVIEVPHLTQGGAGYTRDDGENVDGPHSIPTNNKISKDSICGIYCHRSAAGTVKLKDLAIERSRRPNYQADEIIAKYAMGHGGLRREAVGLLINGSTAYGTAKPKAISK